MNKKKWIIGIIIVLILGVLVFVFVNSKHKDENLDNNHPNQGEVENKDDSKDKEEDSKDNQKEDEKEENTTKPVVTVVDYEDALKAVVKAEKSLLQSDVDAAKKLIKQISSSKKKELNSRIENVENTIEVTDLITQLEGLMKDVTTKEKLEVARSFYRSNNIAEKLNKVNNANVKEDLSASFAQFSNVLLDTQVPSIKGITKDEYSNKNVVIQITDESSYKATLNNQSYVSGTEITEEGEYTLVVIDEAYNQVEIHFTIDKTAPIVSLKKVVDDSVVQEGAYKESLYIEVNDTDIQTMTLNNQEYTNKTEISEEGNYTFVVTDLSGNKTEISFIIDKTFPVITIDNVEYKDDVLNPISYTTSVTPIIREENIDTITLNSIDYISGTEITKEGRYTLIVTDLAGNTVTVNFEITYPIGSIIVDGNIINYMTFDEFIGAIEDDREVVFTLNKDVEETLTIPENKIVTLDLNQKSVQSVVNNGTVSIQNGTITSDSSAITNNGVITSIDEVTINSLRTGINNKGKIDSITNSTIEARFYPVYSDNGNIGIMKDNTITGHYLTAIYLSGTATIDKIESGTYTTLGDKPDTGTSVAGFGLYISTNAVVNEISGGTFQGNKAAVANYGTIKLISGGQFLEKYENEIWEDSNTFLYRGKVLSITGGKFYSYNDTVKGIFAGSYTVADGYQFKNTEEHYFEVVEEISI